MIFHVYIANAPSEISSTNPSMSTTLGVFVFRKIIDMNENKETFWICLSVFISITILMVPLMFLGHYLKCQEIKFSESIKNPKVCRCNSN